MIRKSSTTIFSTYSLNLPPFTVSQLSCNLKSVKTHLTINIFIGTESRLKEVKTKQFESLSILTHEIIIT